MQAAWEQSPVSSEPTEQTCESPALLPAVGALVTLPFLLVLGVGDRRRKEMLGMEWESGKSGAGPCPDLLREAS